MVGIHQLLKIHLQVVMGQARWSAAIGWGIERLLRNEDEGDLDVVMLAASVTADEAEGWALAVLESHGGPPEDRNEAGALAWVPELYQDLCAGRLSLEELDQQLSRLMPVTDDATWITDLCLISESVQLKWESPTSFQQCLAQVVDLASASPDLQTFREQYHRSVTLPRQAEMQAEAAERERWLASSRGQLH
jgi:hypothetical protein